MSRVRATTLLSLEQFARILGYEPRLFQGVVSTTFPETHQVNGMWFQEAWQSSGKASREELGDAIAQAERLIAERMGFWPAPVWIDQETARISVFRARPGVDTLLGGYGSYNNSIQRSRTVKLKWGEYVMGGRRNVTELDATATIVYLDEDGDGYDEIAQISLAGLDTTGWVEKEVQVFPDDSTAINNRIRGLTVTLTAATAVIRGNSALFVDPDLWISSTQAAGGIDGANAANYLAEAYVARVFTSGEGDANAPVEFLWQDFANNDPPGFVGQTGTMQWWYPEKGQVSIIPANWSAADSEWNVVNYAREPILARLYYEAGYPTDDQGRVQPPYARAIAALATAIIAKPLCAYGPPENLQQWWQEIPENATFLQWNNPWGAKNGAFEAYQSLKQIVSLGVASL